MVALAHFARAVLGSATLVDGLACTPGSGLNVSVGLGTIYALAATDATAYGSLGTDATQIVKQGLNHSAQTLAVPAPTTAGQSINYLIEAQFQSVDSGSVVLPYYNSANPTVPYNGPSGSGTSQPTVRQDVCALQVKAGTAAATGTQTTPAPDSGWVGVWVVTIAQGATSVVTGNIAQYASAPFIPVKLPQAFPISGGTVSGPVTVQSALIAQDGLAVTSGGLVVSSGAAVFDGGAVISSGGLTVASGATVLDGSLTMSGAAVASAGLTVSSGGFAVTSGNTVTLPAGSVADTALAAQAAFTILANVTSASASPSPASISSIAAMLGFIGTNADPGHIEIPVSFGGTLKTFVIGWGSFGSLTPGSTSTVNLQQALTTLFRCIPITESDGGSTDNAMAQYVTGSFAAGPPSTVEIKLQNITSIGSPPSQVVDYVVIGLK